MLGKLLAFLFCLAPFMAIGQSASNMFSMIRIEAPFDTYLQANPLLMEFAGAKFIKLEDGRKMIISVASTGVKDSSAQDRLRQQKICRQKALANILAETKAIQVATSTKVNDLIVVTIEDGKENGKSVEEILEVTESRVSGIVKNFPIVGTWYSRNGDMFYLAIGGFVGTNSVSKSK